MWQAMRVVYACVRRRSAPARLRLRLLDGVLIRAPVCYPPRPVVVCGIPIAWVFFLFACILRLAARGSLEMRCFAVQQYQLCSSTLLTSNSACCIQCSLTNVRVFRPHLFILNCLRIQTCTLHILKMVKTFYLMRSPIQNHDRLNAACCTQCSFDGSLTNLIFLGNMSCAWGSIASI